MLKLESCFFILSFAFFLIINSLPKKNIKKRHHQEILIFSKCKNKSLLLFLFVVLIIIFCCCWYYCEFLSCCVLMSLDASYMLDIATNCCVYWHSEGWNIVMATLKVSFQQACSKMLHSLASLRMELGLWMLWLVFECSFFPKHKKYISFTLSIIFVSDTVVSFCPFVS